MKKVFIVGSNGKCQYADMYNEREGYTVVETLEESTLVQFTGGADVGPELYNCGVHPETRSDPFRDKEEQDIYRTARDHGLPMVGICRGGQFLNVMCGGRMYQHVDGHAIYGTHTAFDVVSGKALEVTSTHHQMMIPGNGGEVVTSQPQSRCSHKDYVDRDGELQIVVPGDDPNAAVGDDRDVEAVSYPVESVLCFQPHPEYEKGRRCREYFFGLLEARLFNSWDTFAGVTGYHPYEDEEDEY